MKKLFIILTFICALIALNTHQAEAQRGRLKTLTVDTLAGDNNQTLGVIPITGSYQSLFIQVKMTRISTAAGGTLYVKAGAETAAVLDVNQLTNPNYGFAPNDTLSMSDVATQYWNIFVPFPEATKYHIYGDGDANDTVQIETKYFIK